MKKNFFLFILCFAGLLTGLVNGCKKNSSGNSSHNVGTSLPFTEEFDNVYNISTKGWVILDNSGSSGFADAWTQGTNGADKGGVWQGFPAYSYTTSQGEFAYVYPSYSSINYSLSSWLISPVLAVKNGDKISFYTRTESVSIYPANMQVLMNNSASADVGGSSTSVGGFTTVLFDINPTQSTSGYPTTWTKYEYTFSGLSGKIDTRIGFRHYVTNTLNARGIGIDQFRFQIN